MKKSKAFIVLILLLVVGCSSVTPQANQELKKEEKKEEKTERNEKLAFWDGQRKGTNFMNSKSLPDNYKAAKEQNIEFIRLAPDKWAKDSDYLFNDKPDTNPDKDFLIGNADKYEGIVEEDFAELKADLDAAEGSGLKSSTDRPKSPRRSLEAV